MLFGIRGFACAVEAAEDGVRIPAVHLHKRYVALDPEK
jgi:hypothetical protein